MRNEFMILSLDGSIVDCLKKCLPAERSYGGIFLEQENGFLNYSVQQMTYDHRRCNCQCYGYKGVKGEISIEEIFSIPPDDQDDFDESP